MQQANTYQTRLTKNCALIELCVLEVLGLCSVCVFVGVGAMGNGREAGPFFPTHFALPVRCARSVAPLQKHPSCFRARAGTSAYGILKQWQRTWKHYCNPCHALALRWWVGGVLAQAAADPAPGVHEIAHGRMHMARQRSAAAHIHRKCIVLPWCAYT
jgi:hypothetical protein